MISADQPDAELIALGREFDSADAEFNAIDDQMEKISDRAWEAVEPPNAMAFRDDDRSLLDVYDLPPPSDDFYSIDAVSQFRTGRYGLSDGELARKREIVAAWDYWHKALAAMADAFGIAELRPQRDRALARARKVGEQIMRIPACGVAGVIVKARVARWCNGETIEYATGEFNDHNVVDSLIDDLLAMTDRTPPPSPFAPGTRAANHNAAELCDSAVA